MAEINFSEKELEKFLCDGGRNGNLKKYLDLELITNQFTIDNNYIDILAYSKYDKSFVIIELKRNNLDYNAYFQCLNYVQKFKHKYPFKSVYGLLIGQNLSSELFTTIYHLDTLSSSSSDTIHLNTVFYNLFSIDFTKGITFGYYNKQQYKNEKNKWELKNAK